jgi:CDP-paratose 2-epimerase
MNILVTGGAGFIGSKIVMHRLGLGDDVTVYDNLSRPGGGAGKNIDMLIEKYQNHRKFHFIYGDVRNFDQLSYAVADKDVIFHVAAQTAMTTSLENPAEDFSVNAQGTFNVLEAARLNGHNPIMIYTSTNKVYGDLTKKKVILQEDKTRWNFVNMSGVDESYPLDFEGPYGCSKGVGDSYFLDYLRTFNMRTVVFRMSGIYGTSQYATEDQGWVTWITKQALENKPITIYGDGKQVRDILYIKDLLDAFDRVIINIDDIAGHVFNIGGGLDNSISVLELINILYDILGISPSEIKYADWRRADQKVYISDITKASRLLGWMPKIDPIIGIKNVAKWLGYEGDKDG